MDQIQRQSIDGTQRRKLAVARAQEATRKLAALGVDVLVIGSLASGRFSTHSDIDFLVVEYPRQLKYAIEGLVEDSMAGFLFDVVYLDEVPPAKRTRFLEGAINARELR